MKFDWNGNNITTVNFKFLALFMFQESLAKVALKKICVRNLMNSAVLYLK